MPRPTGRAGRSIPGPALAGWKRSNATPSTLRFAFLPPPSVLRDAGALLVRLELRPFVPFGGTEHLVDAVHHAPLELDVGLRDECVAHDDSLVFSNDR